LTPFVTSARPSRTPPETKQKKRAPAARAKRFIIIKNELQTIFFAALGFLFLMCSGAETRGIDSEDRDLSIGEVSAPMDATNKSYGRFKLLKNHGNIVLKNICGLKKCRIYHLHTEGTKCGKFVRPWRANCALWKKEMRWGGSRFAGKQKPRCTSKTLEKRRKNIQK